MNRLAVKKTGKKLNIKNIAFVLTMFFLFSVYISFVYPPIERRNLEDWFWKDVDRTKYTEEIYEKLAIKEAFSMNYNQVDCFFAVYKNTILGWVDKSKDIKSNYYIEIRKNKFEYYLMTFASFLPYLILIFLILFWGKIFIMKVLI